MRVAPRALLLSTGWAPVGAVDPHELDPEATPGGALLLTAEPLPEEPAAWT